LFRFVVAERMGTIIVSALAAHTAWHWLMERYAVLLKYRIQWPALDAAFLAILLRWMMLAVALAAAAWLVVVVRQARGTGEGREVTSRKSAVEPFKKRHSPGRRSEPRTSIHAGYSSGSLLTSSRAFNSSAVNATSTDFKLSSSWAGLRAPMITLVTTSLAKSHASATRATLTSCAVATVFITSRIAKPLSLSTGGKSNLVRRAVASPLSRVNLPDRKPPASGLQTSSPRP